MRKNCIHLLITEDRGIHKKAKRTGLIERVLTVDEAVSVLLEQTKRAITLLPNIQNVPCHTLKITEPFFDSLRQGYNGFNNWFGDKCAKTGRLSWVWFEDGMSKRFVFIKQRLIQ